MTATTMYQCDSPDCGKRVESRKVPAGWMSVRGFLAPGERRDRAPTRPVIHLCAECREMRVDTRKILGIHPGAGAMTDPCKLIADGLAHDAAMLGGEWMLSDCGGIFEILSTLRHVDGINMGVVDGASGQDALGIAWQRNHLREILDGYQAALDEVAQLRAEIAQLRAVVSRHDLIA